MPLSRDIALRSGVAVRGRITISRTGKPLSGTLSYFIFSSNPHYRKNPDVHLASRYQADADGHYEIPVLPGLGLITFSVHGDESYPRGVGADKIDGPKSVTNAVFFLTAPFLVSPENYSLLAQINPADDATEVVLDLTLTSGQTLIGHARTDDGQPVTDYHLYGEQAFAGWFHRRRQDTFEVSGYFPGEGRRVMVYQPERNLIGLRDFTGEAPAEFDIILKPAGAITGRIIDDTGAAF